MESLKKTIKNIKNGIVRYSDDKNDEKSNTDYEYPIFPNELLDWYSIFDNHDKIIVELPNSECYFYSEKCLFLAHEGYRFVLNERGWHDNVKSDEWDFNWIILGHNNSNPIIYDISDKKVKFDYVGGRFSPYVGMESLNNLKYFLENWINTAGSDFVQDKPLAITKDAYTGFIEKLNVNLNEEEVEKVVDFFGLKYAVKSEENTNRSSINSTYKAYLIDFGINKMKVISQLREYLSIDNKEVLSMTKNLPVLIFEGHGENILRMTENLVSLGAKVDLKR